MKLFLDTNVLVSAFATRGLCADVLRLALLEHEVLVGEVVLTELRRVLLERIRLPEPTVEEIEALLREQTLVPRPPDHLHLALADPDDEWVVASAVASGAEILVTGDAELLALQPAPLPILSPRGLWEALRSPE